MIWAKSCSKGFESRPSAGGESRRRKGLDVSRVNSRKPKLMTPNTPSTRAAKAGGKREVPMVTATVQHPKSRIQSSKEPSCAPHTAAARYMAGSAEFELAATYCTEKS